MKAQICTVVFSTILLFTARTNALSTLIVNSTDSNIPLAAVKTGVNCWPSVIRGSRLAATKDCLQAALLLPEGSDAGEFRNGNPIEEYRLPLVRKFETCAASVSLEAGSWDRSSWDHISYVASQMALICVQGQYPSGQTGGVTYLGSRNLIRLSLERVVNGVGDTSSQ